MIHTKDSLCVIVRYNRLFSRRLCGNCEKILKELNKK